MQKEFEVRFTVTKERINDFYNFAFFGTPIAKLLYVLFALILADALWLALCFQNYRSAAIAVFATLFLGGLYLFRVIKTKRLVYARDLEMNNGTERISVFTANENGISKLDGEKTITVPFESIKKAKRTKKYLFVQTNARMLFAFPADSFTVGDINGLEEFLKYKFIKVK